MWGPVMLTVMSTVGQPGPPASGVISSGALSVRYSTADPTVWGVSVSDRQWLASLGEPVAVARGDGTAVALVAAGPGEQTDGKDVLGEYTKVETRWSLPTGPPVLVTSIRVYTAAAAPGGTVVFGQEWPLGWNQTGPAGSASEVIAAYPAFSTDPSAGPWAASAPGPPPPLNFLSFGGCQLANTFGGKWTGSGSVPDGERLGIPLVLYGRGGPAVALSPATNWMIAVNQAGNHSVGLGIKRSVRVLPAGFRHETMLVAGTGITAATQALGDALLARGGKQRADPYGDFVLSHLGYWTDNGAFYGSANDRPGFANHEEALKAMKAEWTRLGIPFRYAQWDDWQWTDPTTGHNLDIPGIVDFPPDKRAVPDGLTNWLGVPSSLYAPMWSANNSYIDQYRWIVDETVGADAGAAIPVDPQFYRDVFKNGSHADIRMFEQDFLCYYDWNTNLTNSDVASGMAWLKALDTAAAEAKITVQLCMMQPIHALASTELSTVTNGRGTSDNTHNGGADLYALGTSGLLMWAMGLWPSRDNVYTTAIEPGCVGDTNKSNCTSPDFRLQNVAAVLSGGPYGPSDGIGYLNAELIGRSCRSDGVLQKADVPLAVTDFAFAAAFDTPHESIHVWATHSDLNAYRWMYVLSVNTPSDLEMTLTDLNATHGLYYVVYDFWGSNGSAPSASSVKVINHTDGKFTVPMSPPQAPVKGGSDAGTYQMLAPILGSGWCLLGEAKKIVPVSRRRFISLRELNIMYVLEITVWAASNEEVTLWLLAPQDPPLPEFKLIEVNCPQAKSCDTADCNSQGMKVLCSGAGWCTCEAM